jgi:hypothetical protein
VSAYRTFEDVPGFARVVSRAELAENDDNLNIRRYVDTTPPPEPQDVRAHLHGAFRRTRSMPRRTSSPPIASRLNISSHRRVTTTSSLPMSSRSGATCVV